MQRTDGQRKERDRQKTKHAETRQVGGQRKERVNMQWTERQIQALSLFGFFSFRLGFLHGRVLIIKTTRKRKNSQISNND